MSTSSPRKGQGAGVSPAVWVAPVMFRAGSGFTGNCVLWGQEAGAQQREAEALLSWPTVETLGIKQGGIMAAHPGLGP